MEISNHVAIFDQGWLVVTLAEYEGLMLVPDGVQGIDHDARANSSKLKQEAGSRNGVWIRQY
jgi:hypothetical protein